MIKDTTTVLHELREFASPKTKLTRLLKSGALVRIRQSGHWKTDRRLDAEMLTSLLYQRFSEVDFQQAAREVRPFVDNPASLDLWSEGFFRSVSQYERFFDKR